MKKYSTPKGFEDAIGDEPARLEESQKILFEEAALFGAQPIHASVVGFPETFFTDTNLGQEKVYNFSDKKGREMLLNPDSLPAVMRSYVDSKRQEVARAAFCIPVHRYRNTRRRNWHHLGVSTINEPNEMQSETVVPEILLRSLNRITSQQIHMVLNNYEVWNRLFNHYDISFQEARDYFFYKRFHKNTSEEELPQHVKQVLSKISESPDLVNILDQIHSLDPQPYSNHIQSINEILPQEINFSQEEGAPLIPLLERTPNIGEVKCNMNEFHSSEFFSRTGWKMFIPGEKEKVGDGGSYHEYGQRFSPKIKTVHSGILRWEDLLNIDDKVVEKLEKRDSITIFFPDGVLDGDQRFLNSLREQNIQVLEITNAKNARKAMRIAKENSMEKFLIIGNRSRESGQSNIINLKNGKKEEVVLDEMIKK